MNPAIKLYLETYDKSYKSYGESYCKTTGAKFVMLSDRHPSYMKLILWSGQAMYNWLNNNFYKYELGMVIYTNASFFGSTYACAEEYLKFLPKIMLVQNAEVEYPEVIVPHSKVHVLTDVSNYMVADALIFSTHAQKDLILERLELYISDDIIESIRVKCHVVPMNGISLDGFEPDYKKRTKKFRILWNHRLSSEKRPDLFLESLKILKEKYKVDFELILLAEKTSKKRSRELLDELEDVTGFYGFLKSKHEYIEMMQSCDVVVSTSLTETFGLSVVEAVACGCKPVITNAMVFPEVFQDGFNEVAWMNDDETAQDWAEKLSKLVGEKNKCPELIEGLQRYSSEITGPLHVELLNEIVEKFNNDISSRWKGDVRSGSTDKLANIIEQNGVVSKKKLMSTVGWVKMDRWPVYSLKLQTLGFEIEHTEDNVFFKVAGEKVEGYDEWGW